MNWIDTRVGLLYTTRMNTKESSFNFTKLYLVMICANIKIEEFRERAEEDVYVPPNVIAVAKKARADLLNLEDEIVFGMHTQLFNNIEWDDEDEFRY